MDHMEAFVIAYGYLAVFSLLMLGIVGLPVPDEWVLTFAGYLAFKGYFHPVPILASAVLGSVCGISVSYGLGRTLGNVLVRRYGRWFRVTDEKMERVRGWFDRTGRWSLTIGYFIPGFRHVAGVIAGTSKLRFPVFALFAYTGASVWSASFVAIGYFTGEEWARTTRATHRDIVIGAALAAILILLYIFLFRSPLRKK
jgi:membrane protein DedA with SNARE-associated domain